MIINKVHFLGTLVHVRPDTHWGPTARIRLGVSAKIRLSAENLKLMIQYLIKETEF